MPGWNIHLEAGERVAKKLKLSGIKRKEFLFGCILPDINNGYINNVKTRKHHEETHYAFNQKSSLNFYAENKSKIDDKEPLYLGYLLHLYIDGFFNYDFYRTIKRSKMGQNLTREEKSEIKHHDFWLFDTCFHHHFNFDESDRTHLAHHANTINAADITPEDIEDIERILLSDKFVTKMKGQKYKFYSKKRLENLIEDAIESFSSDYLGARHA